jgi:hypothetical protein
MGHRWRRHDLVTIAFHRYMEALHDVGEPVSVYVASASDDSDDDLIRESVLAVAADRGGRRRRVDAVWRRREEWLPDALVIDGDTYWARTGNAVTTNHGDPRSSHGGADIIRLLLPSSLPAGFDLAPTGEVEQIAGRRCAVVSAAPREADQFGRTPGSEMLHMIAGGTDFRVSIDVETSALLKVVKFVDGQPAEVCEFTEIAFDQPLSDDLFAPLS